MPAAYAHDRGAGRRGGVLQRLPQRVCYPLSITISPSPPPPPNNAPRSEYIPPHHPPSPPPTFYHPPFFAFALPSSFRPNPPLFRPAFPWPALLHFRSLLRLRASQSSHGHSRPLITPQSQSRCCTALCVALWRPFRDPPFFAFALPSSFRPNPPLFRPAFPGPLFFIFALFSVCARHSHPTATVAP
jgi:hypothetical protein